LGGLADCRAAGPPDTDSGDAEHGWQPTAITSIYWDMGLSLLQLRRYAEENTGKKEKPAEWRVFDFS
jgi:hypothetical protein